MKILTQIVIIFVFFGLAMAADYLVCDLPTETITDCEVRVNGTVANQANIVCARHTVEPHFVLMDITGIPIRPVYEARWSDDGGVTWSDWSSPYQEGISPPSTLRTISE